MIQPGCAQHIGSRREQQDCFAFSDFEDKDLVSRAGYFALVADGMGGMAMGRDAANIAVRAAMQVHQHSPTSRNQDEFLSEALSVANNEVRSFALSSGVEGDSGTTLVAASIKGDNLFWASAGDSRIYLNRNSDLTQLTVDQNFQTELLLQASHGTISREEALNHPEGAGLTNYVGAIDFGPIDANKRPLILKSGDWVLLCSDGLYGTLSDLEIHEELYGSPHLACERLVKKTISCNRRNQDNVTVAILAYGDREPKTVRRVASDTSKAIRYEEKSEIKVSGKFFRLIILASIVLMLAIGFSLYSWLSTESEEAIVVPQAAQTPVIESAPSQEPLKGEEVGEGKEVEQKTEQPEETERKVDSGLKEHLEQKTEKAAVETN